MDRLDEQVTVKKAVKEVLGWSEGTYRRVLTAIKGPKGLLLPRYTGGRVCARELAEWWRDVNRL